LVSTASTAIFGSDNGVSIVDEFDLAEQQLWGALGFIGPRWPCAVDAAGARGARHQEPAHITIFIRTLLSLDIILRNVD